MQADIWAKKSEAGDINELDPLQHAGGRVGPPRPFTCTSQQRSAMQSLQYAQSIRAIQILEQSPLCATAKRRRSHLPIPKQEKTAHQHVSRKLMSRASLGYRDIQCTHCHPEHHPLLVSLECEFHLAHTHQCCDYSLSQAAEQSGESHHVLTKLHGHGMSPGTSPFACFS